MTPSAGTTLRKLENLYRPDIVSRSYFFYLDLNWHCSLGAQANGQCTSNITIEFLE